MEVLKKLIPTRLLKLIRPIYHGILAFAASIYFDRPSERLVVIGITGTAGKSTTAAMLAHILNYAYKNSGFTQPNSLSEKNKTLGSLEADVKTSNFQNLSKSGAGYITTVNFFDGNNNFINKHGLSMPGGWLLQKQLKQILDNGCKFAVVECTSEGLEQNRHLGINFDVTLFTNLSEAHLDSHGSFGNYQQAKGKLFEALQKGKKKTFFPRKILGVNLDDPISGYFVSFPAQKKFGVTFKHIQVRDVTEVYTAALLKSGLPTEFTVNNIPFRLEVIGNFNAYNAGLAVACANSLGIELTNCAEALKHFYGVRGRMENVPNNLGFQVIVDYACEPASFKAALEAAAQLPHNRLIHVFGSTGGHRDVAKRFIFGKTSAQYASQIIVTNDDIYESDPQEIAKNIEEGIKSFKLRQPPYEIILDRRAAIAKALAMAKKDDIVFITGKGSEQFLVLPGNKRVEWDEASVVREELNKIK